MAILKSAFTTLERSDISAIRPGSVPPHNSTNILQIHTIFLQDLTRMLLRMDIPAMRVEQLGHLRCEILPVGRYAEVEQRLLTRRAGLDEEGPAGQVGHVLEAFDWRFHELDGASEYRGDATKTSNMLRAKGSPGLSLL